MAQKFIKAGFWVDAGRKESERRINELNFPAIFAKLNLLLLRFGSDPCLKTILLLLLECMPWNCVQIAKHRRRAEREDCQPDGYGWMGSG